MWLHFMTGIFSQFNDFAISYIMSALIIMINRALFMKLCPLIKGEETYCFLVWNPLMSA